MTKRRCIPCNGSGRIMGGGCIMHDCDECHGNGHVTIADEVEYLKKDTKSYKSAKKRIKALDPKLSDDEIEKVLDAEIERQK